MPESVTQKEFQELRGDFIECRAERGVEMQGQTQLLTETRADVKEQFGKLDDINVGLAKMKGGAVMLATILTVAVPALTVLAVFALELWLNKGG